MRIFSIIIILNLFQWHLHSIDRGFVVELKKHPHSSKKNFTSIVGPQKNTGLTGPEGPPGPQGAPGTSGEIGPQGPPGPQGSTGLMGPEGSRGPQGIIGEQGHRGITGATGMRGEVGPQGPRGLQGNTGLLGPQGPPGATGEQGPRGVTSFSSLDHLHAELINPSNIKITFPKESFITFNKVTIIQGESIDKFDVNSFIIKNPGSYFIQCTLLTYYSYLGEIQIFIDDQPVSTPIPLAVTGIPLSIQEIIRINKIPANLKIKVLKQPISLIMGKAGSINIIRLSD